MVMISEGEVYRTAKAEKRGGREDRIYCTAKSIFSYAPLFGGGLRRDFPRARFRGNARLYVRLVLPEYSSVANAQRQLLG